MYNVEDICDEDFSHSAVSEIKVYIGVGTEVSLRPLGVYEFRVALLKLTQASSET